LIEPDSGNVWFDGKEVTAMNRTALRALRKDMQIVFQDPYSSLNPRMTVGEAIAEPMWAHGLYESKKACKKKAEELLEKVGLSAAFADRLPHAFSGGQRQRIVIARALALNPRFLICDESVSALDVSVQAQILNLLNELKASQALTYIFISHDLSVVKFMSDRMLVMQNGHIEEAGDPDTIFASPKSSYTIKLIDAIPGKQFI
ncbi:MAG: ABC transporter ATP-binding protein, partial [Flavobacteriales bacterium]|nr:ABC transporter ATP-binding protein [Flavobacteriales bacterium]